MSAKASSRLDFILSLTDKVTAPLAKVSKGFNDLAEQGENNIKQMGLGLGGLIGSAKGITESMQPALEMNRALGEVRSLGVAEDALDALNSKSLEFSVAYGENAQEFVASAYKIEGAIKGLAGSQLATFTNTSSVLAKATKSDKEVMSEYVGTLYNLQKQQADAMGKSQWVEKLGGQTALAVQLFRTSGEQMKDGFKEAGAIATAAGIDLAEQMAVIGSLSSTMEGGDAGGRYKAFFENIENASEKLGMKFTDTNGKVMPMLDILAKLQGKFGDLRGAAANAKLMEAFGGEGAQVIGALAQDTDRLKNGIDKLGKVRGLEQAEKMAKAMVDPWQQFGAAVQALRIAFGQALIPILQPLMDRLVGIGKTLVYWTQLFPNITRVIGITVLSVLGIVAAMSALTLAVGISKMVWMGTTIAWNLFTWAGWRSIAMFLYHAVMVTAFVAGLVLMYTVMGLVRVAMLLWQGAIWLVNAALLANPIGLVIVAIVALVAAVVAIVAYWDELTTALMKTAAFQWVAGQVQALGAWFNSMGGWTGLARAAWAGIVSIFQKAINGLIEMLNKIPGVNIETQFGDLPEPPKVPEIPGQAVPIGITPMNQDALQPVAKTLLQVQPPTPLVTPMASAIAPPPPVAKSLEQTKPQLHLVAPMANAMLPPAVERTAAAPTAPALKLVPPVMQAPAQVPASMPAQLEPIGATLKTLAALPQTPVKVEVAGPVDQVERNRERLSQAAPSLSPVRPAAVPQGGLLSSIQNHTQNQNRGIQVQKVEIHTSKPLTPLELENMIDMAVG
ncbi:phage tail tape measure protein [Pseudomonas chlororaphis]|uniref:phage tail tape measure protein n=1 Tax=Pseudomonas chlororaphis TaxID=587753 RepID=UPI000F57B9E1|nr:phage tail tape measure protein [Pseudomonas chlororaphis]AZC59954.1 Phage-related tail protein [Pseudomonas chlororaphis subsp. piscium]